MRKPHARRNLFASLWNMCCYVSTRTQFVHASNRPTCCFRTSGPCLLQFGVAFQHECFHHLEANDKALQSTAERWTMYSFMNSFAFSKSFTWLIATFPMICHFFWWHKWPHIHVSSLPFDGPCHDTRRWIQLRHHKNLCCDVPWWAWCSTSTWRSSGVKFNDQGKPDSSMIRSLFIQDVKMHELQSQPSTTFTS